MDSGCGNIPASTPAYKKAIWPLSVYLAQKIKSIMITFDYST